YLDSGGLGFTGSGASLTLTLTAKDSSNQVIQTLQAATTLTAALDAIPSITVPPALLVESGHASPISLAGTPFTGTGTLTLEVSVTAGSLAATTGGLTATALVAGTPVSGVTLLAGSTSTLVKLQGTAASLNSYLTSDKLRFTHTGVGTLASLGLKLINGDGLRSAAATLSLQAAVRTETQGYGGAMVLPKTLLATPGALLPITLASDAFEAAAGWITVEIEAPRSAFSITGMTDPVATIGAISGVNVQSASITPAGGGASVPVTRFTGTSANVNALFSTPGQVLLNTTGISTLKLRLAGSEASITITTKTAEDVGYGASITLPQAFLVSSGTATALPFAAGSIVANATTTVTLKLSVGAGDLQATDQPGSGTAAYNSATRTLTLTGTAASLSTYLQSGKVAFVGTAATALDVVLETTVAGRVVSSAARSELIFSLAPTLSVAVPASLSVWQGVATDVRLATNAFVESGANGTEFSVTIAAGGATLAWASSGTLKQSNGSALSSGSGTTLTVRGTAAAMNSFFSAAGSLRVTTSSSVNLTLSVSYVDTVNASGSYISLTPVAPPTAAVTGLPELRTLVGNGWSLSRTNSTDQELWLTSLTTGTIDRGSDFDQTGSGWVRANTTDDYIFWITGDDRSEFKLYDDAGNVIAHALDPQANTDPNYNTSWAGLSGGNTHYSPSVRLEAGRYYRFEVEHSEGGSTEFFRVGYTLAQDKPSSPPYVVSAAASSVNYPPVGTLSGTTSNTNDERPGNVFDGIGGVATLSSGSPYSNRSQGVNTVLYFQTTGTSSGSVWGSGTYTDDSAIGKAAVHAGVLAIGQTGVVKVTLKGPQSSFASTSQNGITTSSYGSWGGSYTIEAVANTDSNNKKYLNFDEFSDSTTGRNSGVIVRLSSPTAVNSIQFQRANYTTAWDPLEFTIFGSNSNLDWGSSAWTSIYSGPTKLENTSGSYTLGNWQQGPAVVEGGLGTNTTAYSYYKIVFTKTRGSQSGVTSGGDYFMQLGEITLGYGNGLKVGAMPSLTASPLPLELQRNGSALSLVPDFPGENFTATLTGTSAVLTATNLTNSGVTASGDGTSTLALTGTLDKLSAYLNGAGNVRYQQGSSTQTLSLTVTPPATTLRVFSSTATTSYSSQPLDLATGDSSTRNHVVSLSQGAALPVSSGSRSVTIAGSMGASSSLSRSPLIEGLPASLSITAGVSSRLDFVSAVLADGNPVADDTLVLTLKVASGNVAASSADADVSVGGTATARTLTGKASALAAFLARGDVSYTGSAVTLAVELASESQPSHVASTTVSLS
ncbi:MAG: hypothetical protein RL458_801, partial [Pseudomonadota bacterium]